ncbi:MAG: bifunctional UDP-N-acetylglucosamine diphosphorylase/glucosamine-1-phosphate N-acetyltransferase GlmU [bacterium]
MSEWNTQAIILAAGRSTRFKTKKTKMLFNICGRAMILYPIKVLEELNIPVATVLGYQADLVQEEIQKAQVKNVTHIIQKEQLGTGNAVAITASTWKEKDILVLNGDTPLVSKNLLEELLTEHQKDDTAVTFCTTMVLDPRGYGRVTKKDGIIQIVEEKNCTPSQRDINKINAGVYVFSKSFLEKNIHKLEKNSVTGEIYLPALIELAGRQNLNVKTFAVPYDDVRGVNTLEQLWSVEQIKRSEFIKYWMSEGVRFELAQSIHIDINVKIAPDTFIGTGVHLLGDTTIGENCTINAFSILENVSVGNNSKILWHSVIQNSIIGSNVQVGPFARIRNNSSVGNNTTIGNFVEITATRIGENSKTRHLTYLGNTIVGKSVNIGAGTITCNFDGLKKQETIIKDNAFIGSNNTLIAPITIGEGAYTAGGSTLTQDAPAQSLSIGRSKQEIKPDYAHKLRKKIEEKSTCNPNQVSISDSPEEADVPLKFQGAIKADMKDSDSL